MSINQIYHDQNLILGEKYDIINYYFLLGGIALSPRLYEALPPEDAGMMNALQLAYIGDVVWETIIRETMIHRGLNLHHMHSACVEYVNAHAQAGFMKNIAEMLEEHEVEISRRGRNAHARHPAPRNQDPGDYAAATGFEALIGYLYLTGRDDRIESLARTIIGGMENG